MPEGERYTWDEKSTYIKQPPYFDGMPRQPAPLTDIKGGRALAVLGDSVTTDHISPAGNIAASGPAGQYLQALGVKPADFNSYGARRGNHEVMVRGTFANIRLKNLLAPGTEGGVTLLQPSGEKLSIYDAAMKYAEDKVPLVILAGKEYGSGSSRDWAAKGPRLLGVRAVIAESFERIHRSNLVGMGVLPLQFAEGDSVAKLGLTGKESFEIGGIAEGLTAGKKLTVKADGKSFQVLARIDTPDEARVLQARRHPALRAAAAARREAGLSALHSRRQKGRARRGAGCLAVRRLNRQLPSELPSFAAVAARPRWTLEAPCSPHRKNPCWRLASVGTANPQRPC